MEIRKWFLYRVVAAVKRSMLVTKALFYGQGLLRSMLKGAPVGQKGEPIPWFTYPAIEYLKQFDFSDKKIFEYGAGNSSIFWAQRAMQVTAVESDRQWYEHVSKLRPPNLSLILETDRERYISSIGRDNETFDVIVIDGLWRNSCADICVDHLSDQGMIIFDNSDRRYDGCTKLRKRGFFQIDLSGFSPINGYASTTSIFIKAGNRLQSGFSPSDPVGGLAELAGDDD